MMSSQHGVIQKFSETSDRTSVDPLKSAKTSTNVTLFARTRIRIHRKEISFIKEWFKLRWQRSHPLPKGDSSQVELTQQYLTTNPNNENVWISQRLMMRVGKQQYELVKKGRLTDGELDWLADELRQWLRGYF